MPVETCNSHCTGPSVFLLALVIFYHGANGLRLALNEMGIGLRHNKLFFFLFEGIAMVALIVFLYYAWQFIAVG